MSHSVFQCLLVSQSQSQSECVSLLCVVLLWCDSKPSHFRPIETILISGDSGPNHQLLRGLDYCPDPSQPKPNHTVTTALPLSRRHLVLGVGLCRLWRVCPLSHLSPTLPTLSPYIHRIYTDNNSSLHRWSHSCPQPTSASARPPGPVTSH